MYDQTVWQIIHVWEYLKGHELHPSICGATAPSGPWPPS